jgi:hypothetical protein
MNNHLYVLVYSYDNKSISDSIFFNSSEEAIDWKNQQIKLGLCYNPISAYSVKRLESI